MTGPAELDLVSAAAAIRERRLSPLELVEAHLARLAETAWVNAWVMVDAEGARAAAREAAAEIAAGRLRGPLHGIPVGVKDLIDTAGLRTTYGSGRYADHVPERDATVVTRLREAGAVILGKQATHEFAWGGRTDSRHFGATRNPHDAARIAGGSSGGGAAALASGSCLLAVGTDTAGSVRIPAALSGCVGFKPTRGWISLEGVHPLAPSLDHVGLMARTPDDVALAFEALGGASRAGPRGPVRVGVPDGASLELLDPAVRAGLEEMRERLLAAGNDVRAVPDDGDLRERGAAALTLVRAEAELVHRDAFRAAPEAYGSDLAGLLALGPVADAEVDDARRVLDRSATWLRATLRDVDVVLTATVPVVAPLLGDLTARLGGQVVHVEQALTLLTSLADVVGAPALSLPAAGGRLPVGVQLTAAPGADPTVLAVACAAAPTASG